MSEGPRRIIYTSEGVDRFSHPPLSQGPPLGRKFCGSPGRRLAIGELGWLTWLPTEAVGLGRVGVASNVALGGAWLWEAVGLGRVS